MFVGTLFEYKTSKLSARIMFQNTGTTIRSVHWFEVQTIYERNIFKCLDCSFEIPNWSRSSGPHCSSRPLGHLKAGTKGYLSRPATAAQTFEEEKHHNCWVWKILTPHKSSEIHVIQIISPLTVFFFKHGQLDFSKASDSIYDYLTSIFPENFWISWWIEDVGHKAWAPVGRDRRSQ